MNTDSIDQLAKLRLIVGFLGQHKQSNWWDCDFLDATGIRFLETTFPRTAWAAALRSTTEAACAVHDKAVGRVGNYHLFRLPAALEDRMEHVIDKIDWIEWSKFVSSRATAMDYMSRIADAKVKAPQGPVQIGVAHRIITATAVQELAAHYHSAFDSSIRCFPYFAPEKNVR